MENQVKNLEQNPEQAAKAKQDFNKAFQFLTDDFENLLTLAKAAVQAGAKASEIFTPIEDFSFDMYARCTEHENNSTSLFDF